MVITVWPQMLHWCQLNPVRAFASSHEESQIGSFEPHPTNLDSSWRFDWPPLLRKLQMLASDIIQHVSIDTAPGCQISTKPKWAALRLTQKADSNFLHALVEANSKSEALQAGWQRNFHQAMVGIRSKK